MGILQNVPDLTRKLTDPLVVEWALERLLDERKVSPTEADLLATRLFDDACLSRVIREGSSGALIDALRILPAERFRNQAPLMLEQWPCWSGREAAPACSILAKLDPEGTMKLISGYFNDAGASGAAVIRDTDKTYGALQALRLLPSHQWIDFVRKLLEGIRQAPDPTTGQILGSLLIGLAVSHGADWIGKPIIDHVLTHSGTTATRHAGERATTSLFLEIADGMPFHQQFLDLRAGTTSQTFASLARLFIDDAAADQIDRLVSVTNPDLLGATIELSRRIQVGRCAPVIASLADALERDTKQVVEVEVDLAGLLAGLVAAGCLAPAPRTAGASIAELVALASADLAMIPSWDTLVDALRHQPGATVTQAIRDRWRGVAEEHGCAHLVALAGELNVDELLPEVVEAFLGGADDAAEAAAEVLPRFGDAALRALLDRWVLLKDGTMFSAAHVFAALPGDEVVLRLIESYPEMRNKYLEPWCAAAEACPDPRLIKLLEPDLKRNQPVIERTFLTLCLLLDHDHPRLAEFREREERQEADMARRSKARELDEAVDSKMHVELTCSVCGDMNRYEVEALYVDVGDERGEPYVGGDLSCTSCGAQEDLRVSAGLGQIAVIAELMKLTALKKQGASGKSALRFQRGTLADGRAVPIRQAFEHYRSAVQEHPNSLVDWLALGNLHERVQQPRRARRCFSRCIQIDPGCPEAAYRLAALLSQEGQKTESFEIMQRALEDRARWQFMRLSGSASEFGREFDELYNRLGRETGRHAIMPLARAPLIRAVAPGRNDRCPCASGKKYKKCCGR